MVWLLKVLKDQVKDMNDEEVWGNTLRIAARRLTRPCLSRFIVQGKLKRETLLVLKNVSPHMKLKDKTL